MHRVNHLLLHDFVKTVNHKELVGVKPAIYIVGKIYKWGLIFTCDSLLSKSKEGDAHARPK